MFSHTVKGQLYNMELLGKFLASESPDAAQAGTLLPRLIDYELLTGKDGKRTVGFGWFAGGECFHCLLCPICNRIASGLQSPPRW